MPGFLSKIFRRKKEGGSTTKTKKGKQEKAPAEHATPAENNEDIPRQGSFGNTSRTAGGSNSSREKEALDRQNASWEQQRAMFNKKQQQQQQQQQQTTSSQNHNAKYPPVVSHDENFDHSNNDVAAAAAISSSASTSPRLSYQQLQQFERQQRDGLSPHSGPSSGSGHQHQHQHQPLFTMSAELPRQQMNAMDDMNRSDASSSSFNLSTDAEDSEYEQLRRGGRLPGGHHHYHTSTLDTSNMSQISAPTAYTTDDDHIFPALQTDDDMTQATAPSTKEPSIHHHHHHHHPPSNNSMLVPLQTPDDEPGRIQIFPMNNETEDDLRAWTISPSTQASKDPTSASSHQRFTFQGVAAGAGVGGGGTLSSAAAAAAAAVAASATPNSTSRNTPGAAHRNFTSPKSQASSNTDFSSSNNDDFANFADFSNFHSTTTEMVVHPHPWSDNNNNNNNDDKLDPPTRDNNNNNGFDSSFSPRSNNNHPMPSVQATSTSTSNQDTSLSDLLAQAKNKSRRGSRSNNHRSSSSRQHSSSSVNSAPAITASYLRQHHNLGRYSTGNSNNSGGYGGGGDRSERDSRTSNEGTSVSDIIESLELTNQSRMKTTGRNNAYSHSHSVGDVGGPSSSIHAAKERLREKRRKEREYNGGLHKSRSSENSSSENSENEASESWLFDEVTGALGPRGIAADLESLSGRSNRSKNSQGNKSHKSHKSRSRRSRGGGGGSSSRRHTRSSNESVDSRGSRHSRNSRYSHRSTKSFISQMSEQSRSVANDLLRLEMQLAMVGSQENRDDVPVRGGSGSVQGGGGASIGGASRTSRTSRKSLTTSHRTTQPQQQTPSTIARRSKVTVVAPPGKLGIILANKADSKGTVVSGVRTSSVLAEKISPGDRIIAIDGEDVSRMTVSEITTIMSRKADYERCLTVLTTPKHSSTSTGELQMSNHRSPVKLNDGFDSSFQQHQYRR